MGRVYLNRYSAVEVQRRAVKRKKEKTFAVPRAAAEKIFSVSYCNALWKESLLVRIVVRTIFWLRWPLSITPFQLVC